MANQNSQPVAIVTGHSGTIGAAICTSLKESGYYVIGISRRSNRNSVDLEYLSDLSMLTEQTCLSLQKSVAQCGSLKVFIHVAGISFVKRFEEITREEYERVLNVNLSSAVFIAQLSVKLMKASGDGVIIFISSQVALPGGAQPFNSIYSLTKSGFNGLVRSLAVELGPQIRVNAICPGDVQSDLAQKGKKGFCAMTGVTEDAYDRQIVFRSAIKRWVEPAEIVNAAHFLISNPAMTGELLNISGGSLTS